MSTPEFARDLLLEAEEWVDEGIVTREQALRLRERYRDLLSLPVARARTMSRAAPRGGSWVAPLLYTVAGVLVGAASLVVLVAGSDPWDSPVPFLAAAALLVALGVGLRLAPGRELASDALLVASLVPLTFSAAPADGGPAAFLALAVPLALLWWRREVTSVPSLSVVAFTVAAGFTFFDLFASSAAVPWLTAQGLLLVAVVATDRLVRHADATLPAALSAAAFAIALVVFLDQQADLTSLEAELTLGAVMLGVLGVGVWLRHRGLVVGAAAAVAVDAIVFAFDVGGVVTGTLVLLALAGALVWQAEHLRRWFRA